MVVLPRVARGEEPATSAAASRVTGAAARAAAAAAQAAGAPLGGPNPAARAEAADHDAVGVPVAPEGRGAAPNAAAISPSVAPVPSQVLAPAPPELAPVVQVLTFGPGDHPFSKFGHDALRLSAPDAGRDEVYNFGTFASLQSPQQLVRDFLARKILYWLSRSSMRATELAYRAENRTIFAQTLALDAEAARQLQAALEVNALPQNRAYAYDYFLDNCATRVRDAVDRATGGALHAAAHAPARLTFRGHALRLTADDWPLYLGLSVVLGPSTDRPIDRWLEMFLPEVVAETLRDVSVPDGHGGTRRLVAEETLLVPANRAPSRQAPPDRRLGALAVGAIFAVVAAALLRLRVARKPVAGFDTAGRSLGRGLVRVAGGALLLSWGLLAGGLGAALALAWFGTPHLVAHDNQNLFLFCPLALLLVPLGFAWMFPGALVRQLVKGVLLVGVLSAVGVSLAKLFSLVPYQDNGLWIALAGPAWLGLAWGAWMPRQEIVDTTLD